VKRWANDARPLDPTSVQTPEGAARCAPTLSGGRSTLRPYDPIDFGVLKLLSGGRSTLRPYDPIDSGVLKLLSGGRSTLRPLEFVHISSIFIAEVEHGARRFAGPHKNCRAQESHTK